MLIDPCVKCEESYPECDHVGDGLCVQCAESVTLQQYKEILIKRVESGMMSAEDAFESYEEAFLREPIEGIINYVKGCHHV